MALAAGATALRSYVDRRSFVPDPLEDADLATVALDAFEALPGGAVVLDRDGSIAVLPRRRIDDHAVRRLLVLLDLLPTLAGTTT